MGIRRPTSFNDYLDVAKVQPIAECRRRGSAWTYRNDQVVTWRQNVSLKVRRRVRRDPSEKFVLL